MTFPSALSNSTLDIYLSLAQYPILSAHIRARMRRELFNRGIVKPHAFEAEVREKAIHSQAMEGLHDPFFEEPADIWETRLMRVRDHMTDFYFAYNLPYDLFEQIVRDALQERGAHTADDQIGFNPELASQSMLFDQAMTIEKMPPVQRAQQQARLQEIKVVLIRTLISDQLAYVKIAKDWFNITDLNEIRLRKIGQGKIGGKAAGMLLAYRILYEEGDDEIRSSVRVPESFFIGADLTYTFMALNGLMHWADQKYKLEEQIRAEYPRLQAEFLAGEFPADIIDKFRDLLEIVGQQPLIVRSSSLLEDSFGTSFAGKYESHFCPNQGTPEQNLHEFTQAILRIYASSLNPDALMYRRAKGLQDYDERMAILIQTVQGEKYDKYLMPHGAGVAFSRNLYRWTPQIHREDGFMRLVWGMGTRAVDRVGNDYPRLVALSHPLLHPEKTTKATRLYSQQEVDVIDLQDNTFKTVPATELMQPDYPALRYLVQVDQGGYMTPLRIMLHEENRGNLIVTFDELLRRTPLARRMSHMLKILEKNYFSPVDTEFTVNITQPDSAHPDVEIVILQCRPQSHLKDEEVRLPKNLPQADIIFSTPRMAPQGRVRNIHYVLFVSPECYHSLPTPAARAKIGHLVGRLNIALEGETFICIGPGRWGTSNPDLGVKISYSDIYHTQALVELTGQGIGMAPEPSFGTHFFQDMVESNIFPLAIYLDDEEAVFSRNFFYNTPNCISDFISGEADTDQCLRLIRVSDFRPQHHLELVMDDNVGISLAFLERDQ
jgi:hypothetical protein